MLPMRQGVLDSAPDVFWERPAGEHLRPHWYKQLEQQELPRGMRECGLVPTHIKAGLGGRDVQDYQHNR